MQSIWKSLAQYKVFCFLTSIRTRSSKESKKWRTGTESVETTIYFIGRCGFCFLSFIGTESSNECKKWKTVLKQIKLNEYLNRIIVMAFTVGSIFFFGAFTIGLWNLFILAFTIGMIKFTI